MHNIYASCNVLLFSMKYYWCYSNFTEMRSGILCAAEVMLALYSRADYFTSFSSIYIFVTNAVVTSVDFSALFKEII